MSSKLKKVGQYNGEYDELLNIHLPQYDIFVSDGLTVHIEARHPDCISYLTRITEIIEQPDYVGKNPAEPDSIELVKVFDRNIQIGIKLDMSSNYLYVATLFDIKQSKIERRLFSGRLKKL